MKDLSQLTQFELITEAITILNTLNDIQKRPMKYAHEDELDWKKSELPRLENILDELHWHLNPETTDAQRLWDSPIEREFEQMRIQGLEVTT